MPGLSRESPDCHQAVNRWGLGRDLKQSLNAQRYQLPPSLTTLFSDTLAKCLGPAIGHDQKVVKFLSIGNESDEEREVEDSISPLDFESK